MIEINIFAKVMKNNWIKKLINTEVQTGVLFQLLQKHDRLLGRSSKGK